MYAGVPMEPPACVSVVAAPPSEARAAVSALAMPKSVTIAGSVREQHVLGLDVAMDDALAVRVGERPGHVPQQAHPLGDRERLAAGHPRAERLAPHVGHRVVGEAVGGPGVQDRDDVGVLQPGREPDLAGEALGAQALGELGGDAP